jgi:hypothetical protein
MIDVQVYNIGCSFNILLILLATQWNNMNVGLSANDENFLTDVLYVVVTHNISIGTETAIKNKIHSM